MRVRRASQTESGDHGIDLAPMLDFVLNLLIFFIITAVFVKELGLTVNRPSGAVTQSTGQATSLPIRVQSSGEILVDERVVDLRAVRANVERAAAANPKNGVLILADADAATGLVAEVIDEVHQGGIYNITFSTTE